MPGESVDGIEAPAASGPGGGHVGAGQVQEPPVCRVGCVRCVLIVCLVLSVLSVLSVPSMLSVLSMLSMPARAHRRFSRSSQQYDMVLSKMTSRRWSTSCNRLSMAPMRRRRPCRPAGGWGE